MKQSRSTSLLKSLVNTGVGFAVALAANALVLPLFGWTPTLSENLILTTVYTVISIARGYGLERLFEALGWRTRMSAFALAVLAERQRQITVEGYTPQDDDALESGDMARAAAAYAYSAPDWQRHDGSGHHALDVIWPWDMLSYKPSGFRRDLVKAAALILAEGERFDRNRKRKTKPDLSAERDIVSCVMIPPADDDRLDRANRQTGAA